MTRERIFILDKILGALLCAEREGASAEEIWRSLEEVMEMVRKDYGPDESPEPEKPSAKPSPLVQTKETHSMTPTRHLVEKIIALLEAETGEMAGCEVLGAMKAAITIVKAEWRVEGYIDPIGRKNPLRARQIAAYEAREAARQARELAKKEASSQ